MSDEGDPVRVGWVQVDVTGPCVDPFQHGAHMADGRGIVNVRNEGREDPPVMCLDCYEELRGTTEPT
jgi:hypothetical protein